MKIAIIGMTRTRSSFLLDVMCRAYNAENLFEHYGKNTPDKFVHKFIKKDENIIWKKYQLEAKKETDYLFSNYESFGTKIFPALFMNFNKMFINVSNKPLSYSFDKTDLMDLNLYFNLNQYDKVVLLHRDNLTDLLCSHWYAVQINKFLHVKEDKEQIVHYKPKSKLYLTTANEIVLKAGINSYLTLKHIPAYLDKLGIKYDQVEYNEVPEYVKKNYPQVESMFVDTEFDYRNGILNYKELEKEIEKYLNICIKTTDWKKIFL